jgi:hypothetical protein
METWRRVLEAVLPASPATNGALTDFAAYTRSRANKEQVAGRLAVASDLLVFADEATRLLRHESAASASSSAVTQPIALASSVPEAVSSPLPTGMTTYDARPADAANGSVPIRAATQMANVGSAGTNASLAAESHDREAKMQAPVPDWTAIVVPHHGSTTWTAQQKAAAAASASRGDAMLAMQDISAARLYYENAADAGDARAAMALAETYDATFLTRLGAVGTKPNPAMAADWYRKAAALGNRSAEARLKTLGVTAAK